MTPVGSTSWENAQALGQGSLGPEHEVLAALSGPVDEPSRTALETHGVTHDALFERLAGTDSWLPPQPYDGPIGTNPAWREVIGWAKGLAAARGERLTSADVLLYRDSSISSTLERVGASREDLVRTLAQSGCPVPSTPVRARLRRACATRRVARDHLTAVLERLKEEHPPDAPAHWGFNDDCARRRGQQQRASAKGTEAQHRESESGHRPSTSSPEVVAVLEHGVDLPRAVRTVQPHLVLPGEAAGAVLLQRLDAAGGEVPVRAIRLPSSVAQVGE